MDVYAILGVLALVVFASLGVLLLLEVRRMSTALIRSLHEAERHMQTVVEDAHCARTAWERLAGRLEAAVDPLIHVGETARTLQHEISQWLDRYEEGARAAARILGWVVEAIKVFSSFARPKSPRAASFYKEGA